MTFAREPEYVMSGGVRDYLVEGTLPPGYAAAYEEIAAEHLEALNEAGVNPYAPTPVWQAMRAVTLGALRRYQPRGRILDVGCGPGDLLAFEKGYSVFGVDLSVAYLKLARTRGYEVAVAAAEDLPFRDELFDAVVCADVLEHVLDPHATLRECFRVLAPGGFLVARVPEDEDLTPYLRGSKWFTHLRRFDVPSLQMLFSRVFPSSIREIAQVSVAAEGTLGREILVVVEKFTPDEADDMEPGEP